MMMFIKCRVFMFVSTSVGTVQKGRTMNICTYPFWLLQFVQLLKKCYVVLNAIKVSAWNLKCSLCADYKIYDNAGNL